MQRNMQLYNYMEACNGKETRNTWTPMTMTEYKLMTMTAVFP